MDTDADYDGNVHAQYYYEWNDCVERKSNTDECPLHESVSWQRCTLMDSRSILKQIVSPKKVGVERCHDDNHHNTSNASSSNGAIDSCLEGEPHCDEAVSSHEHYQPSGHM